MINLYDLLAACGGQLYGEAASQLFSDFRFDPSQPLETALYVAHGNDPRQLERAVRQGAAGLLVSEPPSFDTTGVSVIVVRDTLEALKAWIEWRLERLKARRVVIIGDSDATVTAEVARALLTLRHTVCGGAVATDWLSLARALVPNDGDSRVALFRASARDEALFDTLAVLRPDVVIAPGESAAVIERVCATLDEDGLLVLDQRDMAGAAGQRVSTVAVDEFGADVVAYNVVCGLSGTGFDLRYGGQRYVGRWTSLLGRRQLRAVLCGLAITPFFDIAMDDALQCVKGLTPPPGYMRALKAEGGGLLIDNTADASPASASDMLDWLQAARSGGRSVVILGDLHIDENQSEQAHRALGNRAAEVADLFIGQGAGAAAAIRGALEAGFSRSQATITFQPAETIARLRGDGPLRADDVIVVAGGAAAGMERVVRALLADPADAGLLARVGHETPQLSFEGPTRQSWIEVDLEALANNVRQLKAMVGPHVELAAVVKADAYGVGAVSVGRTALLNGAQRLAVASIHEALELREAGVQEPILVLSYTPPSFARHAARHGIAITVYDAGLARAYDRAAAATGRRLRVHLKVDTGMGRLGVLPGEARSLMRLLRSLPNLEVEGVFTHFSTADEDPDYVAEQARVFRSVLEELDASGARPGMVHAANSAATLAFPEYHFDMVRVGLALHGLLPSEQVRVPETFRPVLSWKTFVAQVKTLPDGHPVGYGNTYRCEGEQRIAILPVGYADGFRRAPRHWSHVLIRGQRAPVVGRVSMEKTAVNVTQIPDVAIGDEVVLLGQQGDTRITADEIARDLGTISYEVLTSILARVPRR